MAKISTEKVIGWREWVSLPDLGIPFIKAKVDTGAQTSALHAFDMEIYRRGGKSFVKFTVHPEQRSVKETIHCHAPVIEFRKVKSSNGMIEVRPVIETHLKLMNEVWLVEVTLTNRDSMGFRMLLGRQSFRKRFLVDAGRSYFGLKAVTKKKKKLKRMVKKK